MNRPASHWSDSSLAEPLQRVLDSAAFSDGDGATLERMCARLETALGAGFDARPAGPAPCHSSPSQLRRFVAIGMLTLAAVSVSLAVRSRVPSITQRSRSASPQLPAAAIRPDEPPQGFVSERPANPVEAAQAQRSEPAQPAQSRKHRSRSTSVTAAPGLAEELNGLAQIRGLLNTSPQRALAAADAQQQRFARAALTPERELLRLDALLRLGRIAQAQQLATQLMAAPENHPYHARIAELLARRP